MSDPKDRREFTRRLKTRAQEVMMLILRYSTRDDWIRRDDTNCDCTNADRKCDPCRKISADFRAQLQAYVRELKLFVDVNRKRTQAKSQNHCKRLCQDARAAYETLGRMGDWEQLARDDGRFRALTLYRYGWTSDYFIWFVQNALQHSWFGLDAIDSDNDPGNGGGAAGNHQPIAQGGPGEVPDVGGAAGVKGGADDVADDVPEGDASPVGPENNAADEEPEEGEEPQGGGAANGGVDAGGADGGNNVEGANSNVEQVANSDDDDAPRTTAGQPVGGAGNDDVAANGDGGGAGDVGGAGNDNSVVVGLVEGFDAMNLNGK